MIVHYFTLRALAKELQPILRSAVIAEVFSQQKDELVLSLHSPGGTDASMMVSVTPGFNYLVLRDKVTRARRNSVDLFPSLIGAVIRDFVIIPRERIVRMSFGDQRQLLVRLFDTVESNLFLTDAGETIVEAFKSNKELKGSKIPEALRSTEHIEPDLGQADLSAMASGAGSMLKILKSNLPLLGNLYAREALHRAGVPENMPGPPDAETLSRLTSALTGMLEETKRPLPTVYAPAGEPPVVSMIPLSHLGDREATAFASVNEAIRHAVALGLRQRGVEEERKVLRESIQRELRRLQRAAGDGSVKPEEGFAAERYRETGNLILSHLDDLRKGMKTVELPDSATGEMRRIVLDPALNPAQNAERYFDKARKWEAGRDRAAGREEQNLRRIDALHRLDSALSACRTSSDVKRFKREHEQELREALGAGQAAAGRELPFRVFTVAGGLEVWVGKNSASNDLLTMKYARPHDVWFHIRGAGGSHTVLRMPPGQSPPREAVLAAAAIAAYYSKMRKAGTVPVAYCERKFVRKRRKSPEGEVFLEREEVVFVRPHLP